MTSKARAFAASVVFPCMILGALLPSALLSQPNRPSQDSSAELESPGRRAVAIVNSEAGDRKQVAERYFQGVYGCDPTVVDTLASDDIIVSYPIFETVFGKSVLRGGSEVRGFVEGFCQRWADTRATFHEVIQEDDKVVLVWSFRARRVDAPPGVGETPPEASGWGGITLIYFDADGKIAAEIGEESTPGPIARSAVLER